MFYSDFYLKELNCYSDFDLFVCLLPQNVVICCERERVCRSFDRVRNLLRIVASIRGAYFLRQLCPHGRKGLRNSNVSFSSAILLTTPCLKHMFAC